MDELAVSLPPWRILTTFLVALLLLGLIVYEVALPIRTELAKRFIDRGDTYFASLEFDEASKEYGKALGYDSHSATAEERKALVEQASTDIVAARQFFVDHGVTGVVDRIDASTKNYDSAPAALKAGVDLYTQGQYNYARYPLEQAVKKDPDYPEAWHYLALTYDELAKNDATYRQKADDARAKRDSLTSKYVQVHP